MLKCCTSFVALNRSVRVWKANYREEVISQPPHRQDRWSSTQRNDAGASFTSLPVFRNVPARGAAFIVSAIGSDSLSVEVEARQRRAMGKLHAVKLHT